MCVRGNPAHEAAAEAAGIREIDLVVLNLYAFEATVAKGSDFATCIENVDIGGPSMLRSSAKNHAYVTIATAPGQYPELMAAMAKGNGAGCTPLALRRRFAARAFATSAAYDSAIAAWFAQQQAAEPPPPPASLEEGGAGAEAGAAAPPAPLVVTVRAYEHERALKYGCNPHQAPSAIYRPLGQPAPFAVLNGNPGYINLLDALNAYQVRPAEGRGGGQQRGGGVSHYHHKYHAISHLNPNNSSRGMWNKRVPRHHRGGGGVKKWFS